MPRLPADPQPQGAESAMSIPTRAAPGCRGAGPGRPAWWRCAWRSAGCCRPARRGRAGWAFQLQDPVCTSGAAAAGRVSPSTWPGCSRSPRPPSSNRVRRARATAAPATGAGGVDRHAAHRAVHASSGAALVLPWSSAGLAIFGGLGLGTRCLLLLGLSPSAAAPARRLDGDDAGLILSIPMFNKRWRCLRWASRR